MQWQRIVLVVVTAGIVQSSNLLTVLHCAADEKSDDKILHAYMEAPDVATAIENYRKHGYADRSARSMLVSTSCGVAGCSYEYLVVHLFSYGGTNLQDRSILARVRGTTFGGPRVEVVELTPKRELPVSEGSPAPE